MKVLFFVVAAVSASALAAPPAHIVNQAVANRGTFYIEAGQVRVTNGIRANKEGDAMLVGDQAIMEYKSESVGTSRVWRLTEVVHDNKSNRTYANSSTFYSDGLRAKTTCLGNRDQGLESGGLQCVTMTKTFCENFVNKFNKLDDKELAALGLGSKKDLRQPGQISEEANRCVGLTSLIQKVVKPQDTGFISDDYQDVVDQDHKAILQAFKKMPGNRVGWKLFDWDSGDSKGGFKGLDSRARNVSEFPKNDIIMLSRFMESCLQDTFVSSSGSGLKSPDKRASPAKEAR